MIYLSYLHQLIIVVMTIEKRFFSKNLLQQSYETKKDARKRKIFNKQEDTEREENLSVPDHSSKHTTQTPHIQRVVIVLQVHEKLRAFEVPGKITNKKNGS